MKLVLQITAWVAVILGILAIIGSVGTEDGAYGIMGGILYLLLGFLSLAYMSEKEGK